MKILDIARPSWGTMAAAALAGTAIGFAAGLVVGRDPAAARRAAGRATQWAATGIEQATLWAAQLREHVGDLWAEAREASLGAVDAADFERHAAAAAATASSSASATAASVDASSVQAPTAVRGATRPAAKQRSKPEAKPKARTTPRAMPTVAASPVKKPAAKAPVARETGAAGTRGRAAPRRTAAAAAGKAIKSA